MRLPIALGMAWPDRVADAALPCDWTSATTWEFFPLDEEAFPAVSLARRAGAAGGTAPAVFNGADEACVEAFLAGRIPFTAIVDTVSRVLDEHLAPGSGEWVAGNSVTLDDVLHADAWSRARAAEISGG
jgi:1-deoxy-D-xylulose-5-phosphate reductoisomerase